MLFFRQRRWYRQRIFTPFGVGVQRAVVGQQRELSQKEFIETKETFFMTRIIRKPEKRRV